MAIKIRFLEPHIDSTREDWVWRNAVTPAQCTRRLEVWAAPSVLHRGFDGFRGEN